MGRSARQWDESDIRVRPNRRGSRPRTKERPKHEDAVIGRVTAVDRGRWTTLVPGPPERVVTAMRARELGRTPIVVGDRVGMVGDTSGQRDTLARIVRVEERDTVLRRTADDTDPVERVIVANADQLVVVAALADPEPRPRLIDRCLVAAYDAGMDPLLVLTKSDLASAEDFLAQYAPLDVPHVVTSVLGAQIPALDELRERLAGRVSVLVGHSGVGKSTLVNALVPQAHRATGHVNDVTGRGRHTSTSALALRLPGVSRPEPTPSQEPRQLREGDPENSQEPKQLREGDPDAAGWIIDTPGIRSFGLAHVEADTIIRHFPELWEGAEDGCPRGCSHDEPDCALDAWVAEGHAGPGGEQRLDSLRRLLRARSGEDS
ncbi:ribosome small subunit-dependent GTPase A [Janibacter cremeus]|uniref:ribosome small subunit-dependent GTPase A n=1 Tax=Janibacter cremeus TaxID=1285192 RepID=UPI0023F84BF2|nr:ribosome small subunit-dependent GTPase A [Janibacter cremeus]WEV78185.1 ribosome small subunit-dependent GTPase A [Janibacter cremeus]WEV78265.1 ribosome small subunit-dependent GTPase A [Janibacter cremeus]